MIRLVNTTPFVNDTDINVVVKSDNGHFPDKTGNMRSGNHFSDIAKILPLGLKAIVGINFYMPQDFLDNKPTLEIWYGGRQSDVTQAKFIINATGKGNNLPESQCHHYTIQAELEY